MSEFLTFVQLGFRHIADVGALDHTLFLLALAAIYSGRNWRDSLWVISAFTVGHSITLGLAASGAIGIPTSLVEFLIPLTIVAMGVENMMVRNRSQALLHGRYRPVLAGVFGLVHGAGFANYLQSFFTGPIVVPLFGFNVGLELGQLVVLAAAVVALTGVDRLLVAVRGSGGTRSAHRLRVLGVSVAVILAAANMVVTRSPW